MIWHDEIKLLRTEEIFIKAFLPIITRVYLNLITYKKTLPIVNEKISDNTIKFMVFNHIREDLAVVIMRTCIFEMHDAKANGYLTESTPEKRFEQFIECLCEKENIIFLLEKYTVLNKLLEHYFYNYEQFIINFIKNLNNDYTSIQSYFFKDIDLLELVDIRKMGDRHNHGRSVLILTFQGIYNKKENLKIVYKPHSLSIDVAYNSFLEWINSISSIGLRSVLSLDFDSHGWCEFIEHQSCKTLEQVHLFYFRLGGILAIMHLLNGGDLHFENLLANGDCPIIIDHECIGSANFSLNKTSMLNQRHRRTVLDTLILPNRLYLEDIEHISFDLSAFSGVGGQLLPQKHLVAIHVGTDEMSVTRKRGKFIMRGNVPMLNGETVDSLPYHQDFVDGFEKTYQLLLSQKHFLLSNDSPITLFYGVETRILFRPTSEYGNLLYESYHPKLLYSESEFSKHFDWLKKINTMNKYVDFSKIIKSEKEDLYALDIPLFTHRTDENFIRNSKGGIISGTMIFSGYNNIFNKLKFFGIDDLNFQKMIISQSLFSTVISKNNNDMAYNLNSSPYSEHIVNCDQIEKNKKLLIDKSIEILNFIITLSCEDNGGLYWSHLSAIGQNHWSVNLTDLDLYNGLLGIMLSYSYAYYFYKDKNYLILINKFCSFLENGLEMLNSKAHVGAYSGLGSFLYVIVQLNKLGFISENKKNNLLKKIINHFDLNFKTLNDSIDLIEGSAGYLIALIAIQKDLAPNIFKKQSSACVSHLLKICPDPLSLPELKSNDLYKNKTILGMAHGISGIAWALFEYTKIFTDTVANTWVEKAIDIVGKSYNPETKNWSDTLGSNLEKQGDSFSWCYGTVGQGILRCALFQKNCTQKVALDLKKCVDKLINIGISPTYNICHGSMGAFDFFLMAEKMEVLPAGFVLSQTDIILSGLSDVHRIRAEHIGEIFIPGLMTGLSGIAYQLMRIAHPDRVPSVLSFGLV